MLEVVVGLSLLFIVYAYAGFPLLVLLRGWLCSRPWRSDDSHTPSMSMIICCHNEAAHIGEKLQNILALDYPRERLEVIVASDGSNDGTDEIVGRWDDPRVTLHSYPRRGKIPALNDAVATARGELLVFSDANSQYTPDSLRKLARHFADTTIGCVAGNQVYTSDPGLGVAAAGEKSYWNFDRRLKAAESRAGHAISATGAIYAIRRSLFQEVPSGVTDDFTISTRVIRQGYRLVFEPQAIALESVAGKPKAEFRRKVRVMTRGLRAVWLVRDLLNPFRHGFYSLQLFSHKVVRRMVVFPLLLLLILSPWLWSHGGWLWALAVAQWAVYVPALLGFALTGTRLGRWKPFSIPFYFCLVNAACFVATLNVLGGRRIERWDTHRSPEANSAPQPV